MQNTTYVRLESDKVQTLINSEYTKPVGKWLPVLGEIIKNVFQIQTQVHGRKCISDTDTKYSS